jgi:CBS domain-containing protein
MTPSLAASVPNARVDKVMSKPVLTVEIDASLWDAWQLLFVSGLRHLVVLDNDGSPLGVISDRNVLAEPPATPEHLQARSVRDVLGRLPRLRVLPGDHPTVAATLMNEHSVEAVAVVDVSERLVGIVSESDLVRWLVQ